MKADYIVLAGFLLLLTKDIIQAFPNRIINIHPSLLPAYGGKGMYGMHVHNAVYSNREKETGITIHLVNENYDEGTILCQKKCNIEHCHSPEDIQKAVQMLEHSFFGPEIDKYISSHAL